MQNIKKYFITLALLIMAVTGAWAEEKMVTINSSTMSSGAVTATGFYNFDNFLFVSNKTATITTSEGVITKLVIKKYDGSFGDAFTEANVGVTPGTITYGSDEITVTDINAESVTLSRKGNNNWSTSSVDVYYGEPTEWPLTPDADKKVWTLAKMPANNIELQVEYYPGMLTLPASLTGGTLSVEGLTDPFTKLEVPATWENDNTLLLAAHLPGLKEMTDAEAQNWTDAPNGYVILIYGFDGTKAKTATYLGGEFTNASPEEVTLSQLKTASADAELYYSSEAQMPAGFEKDAEGNIYVEPGTEFQVKVVPNEDYHLVSLTDGTNDIEVDADGIATITMPDEYADLTLTATFVENTYTVEFAEGTLEPDKWSAEPNADVKKGQTVTVTYTGTKKVLGVKAEKKAKAAGPVTYTELKGGEVLHVGDILDFSDSNVEYIFPGFSLSKLKSPYTVLRANIDGEPWDPTVTLADDGAYYVIQGKNGYYAFVYDLPATATSDGILITINGEEANYRYCSASVHEP